MSPEVTGGDGGHSAKHSGIVFLQFTGFTYIPPDNLGHGHANPNRETLSSHFAAASE